MTGTAAAKAPAAMPPPAQSAFRRGFALSVDVEEYFQVWAFSSVVARSSWDGFAPRVVGATRRALDLLDRRGAQATFFTLGWIAERYRDLVREIVARGHELASHGYDHAKVFEQSAAEFRQDCARAKAILEDIAGVAVRGYRAPGFSIDKRTPWAHEILRSAGYRYSSSAHPITHDHYGDPAGERSPYRPLAGDAFIEAPVATAEVLGRRVTCAGGGWFRASPYALTDRLLKRAERTLEGPVIFYFHPWEIDPEQPRLHRAPMKSRLRHYLNLDRMEGKLDRLLASRSWGRIDHALDIRGA
jgi:polysaccharide deacetylase family protein (PEP-CTERM system associated)